MDYALSHDPSGNSRLAFPVFAGFDGSYPFRYPYYKSVFFRKPGSEKPWSLSVEADGTGLCHVSTPELSGRKVFTWGRGRGGRHWMDFLSEENKGQYIELQGGVTPTQLQTRPLEGGASIEWTECIAPFAMDPASAHDSDYAAACESAAQAIAARVPSDVLRETDAFLAAQVDVPVHNLLHRGAGWGWFHEKRIGRQIGPGLTFECELRREERPWVELLTEGTFSPETLKESPRSFVISAGWTKTLRDSLGRHGATWLHHLHLGIASLEGERFEEARASFASSLALKENALAHRSLALLSERDSLLDEAWDSYERAWALSGPDPNLAVELGEFCVRHKRHDAFAEFVASLPEQVAAHERIVLAKAQIALERGDFSAVRRLLDREFCTIREGELSLSDLWFASHIGEAEAREGRELTAAEKEQLKRDFPPPRRIDFRMK
jgi:hypothetical protein